MDLAEWTVLYVKHKDLLARKLTGHHVEGAKMVFDFKDHRMHAYAMETLSVPEQLEGKTLITTLQREENIDFLLKNWTAFAKHAGLTVIFVNPSKNEKWFIVPHTHSQIADPDVELGIRSLAENVPHCS
jgi:hypothetical protein